MDGEEPGTNLDALIRHLRLYRSPPSPYAGDPSTAGTPTAGELFQPRRAAVLVCLFRGATGDLRVFLTKRSSSLSTHSGEVALPGGKTDEGDADDAATALREAQEEIGLDPSLVTVVASLEHFLSKHLLVVVPIVGILSDIHAFKPVLNIGEVDDIFDVPLEMFLKDENRSSEERERMGQLYTSGHRTFLRKEYSSAYQGSNRSVLRCHNMGATTLQEIVIKSKGIPSRVIFV